MNASICQVTTREQLDRLIAHSSANNVTGAVTLLRAVRSGDICLVAPQRDAPVSRKLLRAAARPAILWVGDDDYASTGPGGWACWRRAQYWAAGAMVHATGATGGSYEVAIGMAMQCQRFLLIETDTAHADDWAAPLVKLRTPVLKLVPQDGAHPLPLAREQVQ